MSMKKRILEVLEHAPASAIDVAAELDIATRLASTHLSSLRRRGLIKILCTLESPKGKGGRPAKVYATLEAQA